MYPTFCLNPKADQSKNKNLKKTPRGGVIGTLNTWLKAQCGLNFSNEKKKIKSFSVNVCTYQNTSAICDL